MYILNVNHEWNEMRLLQLVEYKTAEKSARDDHANIWEYGDIREDDAKEFGLTR